MLLWIEPRTSGVLSEPSAALLHPSPRTDSSKQPLFTHSIRVATQTFHTLLCMWDLSDYSKKNVLLAFRAATSVSPEFSMVFGVLESGGLFFLPVVLCRSAFLSWLQRRVQKCWVANEAALALERQNKCETAGLGLDHFTCRTTRKLPL